jgi:hypothetical protein
VPGGAHNTNEPSGQLRDEDMGSYFSESRITVQEEEEAVALRCGCGHGILCELRREGERLGFLAFFDNEPTSENYTAHVGNCPGCGEQLGISIFFSKNRPA